jgi:hypothetical protein
MRRQAQSRKIRGSATRLTCVCVFAAAVLSSANASEAQTKAPIGRFVADVRAASAGLPATEGWTPVVPAATVVPSRGLGLDVGAHVYLLRFRSVALGVGANWLTARAASSPAPPASTSGATPPPPNTIPEVTTRLSTLAPQLSLNFGHSLGWSYLSAGLGQSRVKSEAALAGGPTTFTPRDSGQVKTINFGGGARWFMKDRLGFGFDLRWYKLSLVPATNTHPGAPRASLFAAGAGVVLK